VTLTFRLLVFGCTTRHTSPLRPDRLRRRTLVASSSLDALGTALHAFFVVLSIVALILYAGCSAEPLGLALMGTRVRCKRRTA